MEVLEPLPGLIPINPFTLYPYNVDEGTWDSGGFYVTDVAPHGLTARADVFPPATTAFRAWHVPHLALGVVRTSAATTVGNCGFGIGPADFPGPVKLFVVRLFNVNDSRHVIIPFNWYVNANVTQDFKIWTFDESTGGTCTFGGTWIIYKIAG